MRLSKRPKRPSSKIQKDNELLKGIEPMIWSILSGYTSFDKTEREDIKQETMIFVWNKVIPKFDSRRCKFSSFAYRCAVNFINRKVKRLGRKYTRDTVAAERHYEMVGERDLEAVQVARGKMEYFEKLMGSEQKKYIKPIEMKVVKIIISKPNITQREIALKLGYKYPSAISMMLLRMRRRLEEMNLI